MRKSTLVLLNLAALTPLALLPLASAWLPMLGLAAAAALMTAIEWDLVQTFEREGTVLVIDRRSS